LEKIHLYSEKEERLNTISHFVSAGIALVGVILMFFKVFQSSSGIKFAAMFYTFTTLCVYVFSTIYHGTKDIKKKIFWQKIDHSMVSLIIAGTSAPALLIVANGTTATVMLYLVFAVTAANIVLNLISVHKFKKFSLVLYALGAIFLTVGLVVDIKIVETGFILLFLLSLAVILFGSICYLMKSKEYTHFIWHITDITCSVLHFLAFYLFIF